MDLDSRDYPQEPPVMLKQIAWYDLLPIKSAVRLALIAYALYIVALSIIGIWLFPAYARSHASLFLAFNSWTLAQMQSGLSQLGWPITAPAYVELAQNIFLLIAGGGVGLLLLWKKGGDWFGLYLAFTFLSISAGSSLFIPLLAYLPWLQPLNQFFGAASWQFFFIIFYFFPNGQAEPRWARWLGFGWLGLVLLEIPFPQLEGSFWITPLAFAFPFSAIGCQVYRYLRRSDALQRQQTKWVISAIGAMMLAIFWLVFQFSPPRQEEFLGQALAAVVIGLLFFAFTIGLVPLAIAAAILRYRLWDIDLIIRRTLLYGLITGLLGLVYFGSVVLLRQLLGGVVGNSSAAVILSTLLIYALFNPLRRRLQETIDRRFYRRKYDTEQAVAAFSSASRNNLALEEINNSLIDIINQTLEPQTASVWIKNMPARPPGNASRNG